MISDALIEELETDGARHGLQRTVAVDWVKLNNDDHPDARPRFAHATREGLVAQLVAHHGGNHALVEHKITNGDWLIRRRLSVSVIADDEQADPSFDWLITRSRADALRAEGAAHRTTCTWCDKPAVCIATSEGDPYLFSCDEHCGHGDEEGAHAMLTEPAEMLAIINALHARLREIEDCPACSGASDGARL